jgi:hypothetical protein
MAAPTPATGGRAMVNVFDGTRNLYSDHAEILITARDGNQKVRHREFHRDPSVFFSGLPLFNNSGDDYAFLAAADDYRDAGFFPVKLAANVDRIIDLMLIPKSNTFNFAQAKWNILESARPVFKDLFANGATDDAAAATRYGDIEEQGAVLACLLNITTAMQQINLPQKTAFDYLKRVIWDTSGDFAMRQDRFFAWADPALIDQIELAKHQTPKTFENATGILHPGATRSYKQVQFGEANVQLTFHENDRLDIDGVSCVMVEPDIDYFKDPGAHFLLEVAVNAFGSITDPKAVYALRWIAGRRAGVPEFDPLYTIQKT